MRAVMIALSVLIGVSVSASTLTLAEYEDKCRGAWAGQMIGVSYGSVYEFKYLGRIMEDDIREWQPEFIHNAIYQDDVYVEMTFLQALEDHGIDITNEQAGKAFADSEYPLWHANRYGRENCRNGIMPPLSGHPDHNQHADDIDFQIEADLFGIITPGMPQAMLKLGDRFGHIMNYGDGVYGGMFVAGMYSAAFFEDDVRTVVATGLACIPPQSEYAQLISDVVASYDADTSDWRACWQLLEDKWAADDLCPGGRGNLFNIDAKLNGGYIAIGLLYGEGDFDKTLEISTRCGQDADCNPSNAAGVLGCMMGYDGIPSQYTDGIPAVQDEEFSHTNYDFASLVDACSGVVREIIEANGGEITGRADAESWELPDQAFAPEKTLEQWVDVDMDLRVKVTPGVVGKRGPVIEFTPIPTGRQHRIMRIDERHPNGVAAFTTGYHESVTREDRKAPSGQPLAYRVEVRLPESGWQSSSPVATSVIDPIATNERADENLALLDSASPDAAVLHPTGGGLKDIGVIRDGVVVDQNYDSFDGQNAAAEDWYAIRFAKAARANAIEYVEGQSFHNGGWWLSLTAQYLDLDSFEWRDCANVSLSPEYDFADHQDGRADYTRWTLTFDEVTCGGIRIFGRPGGDASFTSIGELEIYYR